MPTLTWTGKDKVINHHQEVPFRVLEHRYGFDTSAGQTNQETGSGNKIIHGDNLLALKTLLPEYEGRIKCIYNNPTGSFYNAFVIDNYCFKIHTLV